MQKRHFVDCLKFAVAEESSSLVLAYQVSLERGLHLNHLARNLGVPFLLGTKTI